MDVRIGYNIIFSVMVQTQTMWLIDWLYYIMCSKKTTKNNGERLSLASSGNVAYAIRQRRRRIDGSGEYKVYVIDT